MDIHKARKRSLHKEHKRDRKTKGKLLLTVPRERAHVWVLELP